MRREGPGRSCSVGRVLAWTQSAATTGRGRATLGLLATAVFSVHAFCGCGTADGARPGDADAQSIRDGQGGPSDAAGADLDAAAGRAADAGSPDDSGAPGADADAQHASPTSDAAASPDAGGVPCKRGIATNTAPGAAFSPAIAWWYDWSLQGSGADVGIEFAPMFWGSASLGGSIPAGSRYVLGFNEPNFHAQSNLTPQAAAAGWSTLEGKAVAAGARIVSPAVNFCGPASSCNGTDPYQYLKDFFAACAGCEVDHIAVHWYNCDLPSLRSYLEGGGGLAGFTQFGKPIWVTEFSCDGSASAAAQEAYMRAAVPYLESNPHVSRYSWFSASPIPNAVLVNPDGSPTALGQVYAGLPQACRP